MFEFEKSLQSMIERARLASEAATALEKEEDFLLQQVWFDSLSCVFESLFIGNCQLQDQN